MTSDRDDLEQEIQRNLKLRRELGAKAANDENGDESTEPCRPPPSAEMGSDYSGIEELRRKLALKRKLAELEKTLPELKRRHALEAAAAKEGVKLQYGERPPSWGDSAGAMLGLICLTLAIALIALWLI